MAFTHLGQEQPLSHVVLEGLCTSLTHGLQKFLQAHTATIEAYVAQAQTSAAKGPEAAHAALAEEISHVVHFVDTLQTTLTALLQDLPQFEKKRMPLTRGEPETEGHSSLL